MKQAKHSKLEKLHLEQLKVKEQIKFQEQLLNDKIEYLETNFGSMLLNSILPFNAEERSKAYGLFDKVNDFIFKMIPGNEENKKSERFDGVLKSVQMIVAGIVFKYLKKIF